MSGKGGSQFCLAFRICCVTSERYVSEDEHQAVGHVGPEVRASL